MYVKNEIKYWRSGSVAIDRICNGGIPRGLLIEMHSSEGCGKTIIALNIAKTLLMQNLVVCFLDSEYSVTSALLDNMGLREFYGKSFKVFKVSTFKQVDEKLKKYFSVVDFWILDSIASLFPDQIENINVEKQSFEIETIKIKGLLRKYKGRLWKKQSTLLILNQIRTCEVKGNGHIKFRKRAYGEQAMKRYINISMKIELEQFISVINQYGLDTKDEIFDGNRQFCYITAVKNEIDSSFDREVILFRFGGKIDNINAFRLILLSSDYIDKNGEWYTISLPHKESVKVFGQVGITDFILKNEEDVHSALRK